MGSAAALTQRDLESRGFSGFIPFEELPNINVPDESGIYVVLRPSLTAPEFLTASSAGWRGQRDPTVRTEQLAAKWIQEAHIVYIGKADAGAKAKHGLRGRLRQYGRSGAGSSGHWGGRYIWQLQDSSSLLVAWCTTPGVKPAEAEADLIDEFIRLHGKPPFANLHKGNRN
ncbi:hypothetical protein [Streptomyces sp900116325]|uniref:hypothetical protein n=1 Tax=Streptomyces sp. 900116325 TaxID=3154295 RepID=UPI00339E14D0